MSLQSSLCTYVESKTEVTDLISTRFYPQIVKGGVALPFAVYSRVSVKRYPKSTGSTGLLTTVVRIVSFAQEYSDAVNLADQFRDILDGKTGTVGDQYFDGCRLIDESDNIDPVEFAQNDAPHFVSQDYQITHYESVPTL